MEKGRNGFSVRDGGFQFPVHQEGQPKHPHADDPLLIEDPILLTNNVARNTYKREAIQKLFNSALERIKIASRSHNARTDDGLDRSSNGMVKNIFGLDL